MDHPTRASHAPEEGGDTRGTSSARSLLATIAGEFLVGADRPVWTGTLLRVFDLLGVQAKSARQTLARTAADGLLLAQRDGRRARWSVTDAGRRVFGVRPAVLSGIEESAPAWSGEWLLVHADAPSPKVRHQLRSRLTAAGMGSLAGATWLTPYPDKQAAIAQVIDDLGATKTSSSFVVRLGDLGDGRELAARGWRLNEARTRYHNFIDQFADICPVTSREMLREYLVLTNRWQRTISFAPRLPADLLPVDWPGPAASALFLLSRSRWVEEAHNCWCEFTCDPR